MLDRVLRALVEKEATPPEALVEAFQDILAGNSQPELVAAWLAGLRMKGESEAELVALARAARAAMTPLEVGTRKVIDTCGTGGDGSGTFNISTAAALVVAACGQPVVKHGNRGFSSATGSADVLEALGIAIEVEPARMAECLAATGFAFCFAPHYHPATRSVAALRRKLPFRTIFNLLGPVANPASPAFQLVGVGKSEWRPLIGATLAQLGVERAAVVHAEGGLDEISALTPTMVTLVEGTQVSEQTWTPADFGISNAAPARQVRSPAESAETILAVLRGGAGTDAVWIAINAAAALWVAGKVNSLAEGYAAAQECIQDGRGWATLNQIQQMLPPS